MPATDRAAAAPAEPAGHDDPPDPAARKTAQAPAALAEPAGEATKTAAHSTSVAVWGVPSPVVVDRRFAATVGVKCSAGCPLAGRAVVVRDEAGVEAGRGRLGDTPAPGTSALHAVEVALKAPAREGVHTWTAAFDSAGAGPPPREAAEARSAAIAPGEPPARTAATLANDASARERMPGQAAPAAREATPAHEGAAAAFSFRAVSPPEHRVTVTVRDRDTDALLSGAEVRVGVHRGTTGADGRAQVDARAGVGDLYVRKAGYAPHAGSVEVSGGAALQVVVARVSDADPDEEQVWM